MCNIIPTAMGWQNMQFRLMIKMLLLKPSKIFYTFVKLTFRPETTQNERPLGPIACWSHRPVSLCKDGSSTLLRNTFQIRPFISLKCKPLHACNSLRLCGNRSGRGTPVIDCTQVSNSLVRFNLSLTQQIVDSLPMAIMITGLSD